MKKPLRLVESQEQKEVLAWLHDLYEVHSDYVREVVARHAGPYLDAEDLVQEVFIVAHRKATRLMRHTEPRGWLHLAALREVWSARRRVRIARLFWSSFQAEESSAEGPERAYLNREAGTAFYRLLDQLPEKQRTAFILFHVEGRPSAEIGRLLNCPEATVRTRLFHARRAFAAGVEEWTRRTGEEMPEQLPITQVRKP